MSLVAKGIYFKAAPIKMLVTIQLVFLFAFQLLSLLTLEAIITTVVVLNLFLLLDY